MFIELRRSGYTRDGEQFAQGYFLILAQPNISLYDEYGGYAGMQERDKILKENPIRGIVRYVSMRQLGHFMMAILRICNCPKDTICTLCCPRRNWYGDYNEYKNCLSLSGAYGSDGLICSVPMPFYLQGTLLPQDLYDAWANGDGWNSAGNEAHAMRAWGETLLSKRQKANIKAWRQVYTCNY